MSSPEVALHGATNSSCNAGERAEQNAFPRMAATIHEPLEPPRTVRSELVNGGVLQSGANRKDHGVATEPHQGSGHIAIGATERG